MATTIAQEVLGVLRGELPSYPVNDPAKVEGVRRQLCLPPLYLAMRE